MSVSIKGSAAEVNQDYLQVLGRQADPGALADWTAALAAGGTDAEVRDALATSPEAQTDLDGLYEGLLGRAVDPAGLTNGEVILANSGSLQQVRQGIADSAEETGDLAAMVAAATGGGLASPALIATLRTCLATTWTLPQAQSWLSGQCAAINGVYQTVLGRAADPTGLANDLNALAAGVSLTELAIETSQSAEAAGDINAVYQNVLSRAADPSGLAAAQAILASGGGIAGVRSALANSAEAQADMNALYQQALGRPATAADLASAQSALASGASWGQIVTDIAGSPEGAAAANALYQQVLGRPVDAGSLASATAALGTVGYAGLEASLATSAEAAGAINAIYQDVLGRAADPGGMATYEGVLATGGTLAAVRMDLAQSPEAAGVVQDFYQITFGRAATADEVTGMQFAIGQTISDTDQFGLYAANGTCLALTTAGNLLTQLPVAVTLDNGATPILSLPGGATEQFANATQLDAALLGLSLQQGQASAASLSVYQATTNWLVQVDQPMLQVAANLLSQAQLAQSEGNAAQATLATTAYRLALQIAALPPAARGGLDWGLSASVQVNGHTTDVIVYNDTSSPYGNVVYHDKPNDPVLGIVEAVGTVVADILAFVPATAPIFAPIATDLAFAEAGQGFAKGNVLGGVLQLANAVGFGDVAGGEAATGSEILAVSQAVGGASGIVQSAENGDALGAVAGALTIAAAAASVGDVTGINGNQSVVSAGTVTLGGTNVNLGLNLTQTLAALAAGGAVADALNNGDVSSALVTSLGTLFSTIASDVQSAQTTGSAAISDDRVVSDSQGAGDYGYTADGYKIVGYTPSGQIIVAAVAPTDQLQAVQNDLMPQLTQEEGRSNTVYRDIDGYLTVGIGHLVVPGDHLALNDVISDSQINQLFVQDTTTAVRAAMSQATQAGITDTSFIASLADVNFQLGVNWTLNNPLTWSMILHGNYIGAAVEFANGPLVTQTPNRVQAFQNALLRLTFMQSDAQP